MKMFFIVLYRLNNMRFLPRTENLQKIYLTNLQALMDLQYIYIYNIGTFTMKNYTSNCM